MYCKIYINEWSRINIELDNISERNISSVISDYFVYDKIIINKIEEKSGFIDIFVSTTFNKS
jgi:hypothetical protein